MKGRRTYRWGISLAVIRFAREAYRRHESICTDDLMDKFGMTRLAAAKCLSRLVEDRLLNRIKGAPGHYCPSAKGHPAEYVRESKGRQ